MKIKKSDVVFWMGVAGFFGINGIDLIAIVNELVVKLGSGLSLLLIFLALYYNNK